MDEPSRNEQKWSNYLQSLYSERCLLENCSSHPVASQLVQQEIERVQKDVRAMGRLESSTIDIINDKPIRVAKRVVVPVNEHPKFNFVGKLLGPKGNSLKRLQEVTMTKMAVLGRGSIRDKEKEEELRKQNSARAAHLHEDLHVEVVAFATPAEAYARLALALNQLRLYLVPDTNDQIRQEQMMELRRLGRPLAASADRPGATHFSSSSSDSSDPQLEAAVDHGSCANGIVLSDHNTASALWSNNSTNLQHDQCTPIGQFDGSRRFTGSDSALETLQNPAAALFSAGSCYTAYAPAVNPQHSMMVSAPNAGLLASHLMTSTKGPMDPGANALAWLRGGSYHFAGANHRFAPYRLAK